MQELYDDDNVLLILIVLINATIIFFAVTDSTLFFDLFASIMSSVFFTLIPFTWPFLFVELILIKISIYLIGLFFSHINKKHKLTNSHS